MQKLSTSKLAKKLNIPSSQLFQILQNAGLIIKEENIWKLTQKGKENSGTVLKSPRFGYYIAWDSDFDPYKKFQIQDEKYLSRKKEKQEIYKKYNLNLIELENYHIDNLDDYLPKLLLDFGIKVD